MLVRWLFSFPRIFAMGSLEFPPCRYSRYGLCCRIEAMRRKYRSRAPKALGEPGPEDERTDETGAGFEPAPAMEQTMAVPKRKVSPSKRGMRRSADALKAPTYIEDKNSGELRRPHHIDLKTGMYRGKQILAVKD